MSSRIEIAREGMIESGSPSGLNYGNRRMKKVYEGERRFAPTSGKQARAEKHKARKQSELEAYETGKQNRVLARVQDVLGGYEDYCLDGLPHEIRYLKAAGLYKDPTS